MPPSSYPERRCADGPKRIGRNPSQLGFEKIGPNAPDMAFVTQVEKVSVCMSMYVVHVCDCVCVSWGLSENRGLPARDRASTLNSLPYKPSIDSCRSFA